MNKSKHGVVVAVLAIGLIIVAVAAAVLVNELRKERQAVERLEQETVELRQEIENLKTQSLRFRGRRTFSSTTTGTRTERL